MSRSRGRRSRSPRTAEVSTGPLTIFALLVVAGPLAFGAVDRFCQIGLLGLLTIGLVLHPPAVAVPSRRTNALILGAVALLLLTQFAPAALFGTTLWRSTLTESFGLHFPWTHHPEPARALEALLAGTVGVCWFLWVRTLASERENRPALLWTLFASASLVAGVSFATRGLDPLAIYGLRYTPGWTGFGPFPNRNHSGCFLAMGFIVGAGCVAWAGSRRKYDLVTVGVVLLGLILAGLLATQSRGGLIVGAAGLALFFGFALLKFRSRRALGISLAAMLTAGALGLAFGAPVLARFTSQTSGGVSTRLRLEIWQDALRMWKDAPLFGHGLNSFTQLFPIYQEVETGGAIVLHPESSWLQWLTELGAVPVIFGVVALIIFAVPRLREAFALHSSFFLRAAGFSAAAALLMHALFDVPAHRWGTAGFALAALAIACAPADRPPLLRATRKAALVPLGIATFWTLPFFLDAPAWSPLSLSRLLAREQTTPFVTLPELKSAAAYFPLSPPLHQAIGLHQLEAPREFRTRDWQREFRLAARLMPGSWEIAADQARACVRASPGMALHYWQMAIERAGHRADEVLRLGFQETARLPDASAAWGQYVEAHPELLLVYAQLVPEAAGRAAYARWWQDRALADEPLNEREVESFYRLIARWGSRAQLEEWRQRWPRRSASDALIWARLLMAWDAPEEAWAVLGRQLPEPKFSTTRPRHDRLYLETVWHQEPHDYVRARELAQVLDAAGDPAGAKTIICTVAARPDAPEWFIHKAAHLLAAGGQYREAVGVVLAERPIPQPPPRAPTKP